MAIAAALAAIASIVWRTVNDGEKFLRVQEGMTKGEVEAIAGQPTHIRKDGAWYYDLWDIGGDVAVRFDRSERVELMDWSPSYE